MSISRIPIDNEMPGLEEIPEVPSNKSSIKARWSAFKDRFSRTSWFFRTSIIAVIYAVGSLIFHITIGQAGEFFSSVFVELLVPTIAFVGSHLSGLTYIGQLVDLKNAIKTEVEKYSKKLIEFVGTFLTASLGLAAGITVFILRGVGHLFSGGVTEGIFNIVKAIGTLIGTIGTFAGIGNRLTGRGGWQIYLGCAIGALISSLLWVYGKADITMITSVTTFLTGGFAAPVALIATLFIVSYTGASTSAFDYCTRAFKHISYLWDLYKAKTPEEKEAIQTKQAPDFHQYRGAFYGVLTGLVVATIVVALGAVVITQPWLAIPMILGVYFTCTSVFGGICARLGRDYDDWKKAKAKKEVLAEEVVTPQPIAPLTPQVTEAPCTNLFQGEPSDIFERLPPSIRTENKSFTMNSVLSDATPPSLTDSPLTSEIPKPQSSTTILATLAKEELKSSQAGVLDETKDLGEQTLTTDKNFTPPQLTITTNNISEEKESKSSPSSFDTLSGNSILDSPRTPTMAALIAIQRENSIMRDKSCKEEEVLNVKTPGLFVSTR